MKNRVRIAALSKQRGALTVTTPLIVLLIFFLTVLMLDGARLYAVKREMQSIANAAAVAAADAAQACAGHELEDDQFIRSIAESAALAAGKQRLGGSLTVVQPGILTPVDGAWRFQKYSQTVKETNATKVVYSLSTPISSFMPGFMGNIEMGAAAVARKEAVATVSAAGSTAVIGGDAESAGLLGSLLGAILTDGQPFSLDPTDIKSLANTTFVLDDFLRTVGVSDLLAGANRLVPVSLLLEGVLEGLGEGAGPAGDALEKMLDANVLTTSVRLGDVLRSVGTIESPEEIQVPVYDTVVAVLLNTLSGHVVELDEPLKIDLDLIETVSVNVALTVGEPPSVLIAPARFEPDGTPMLEFHAGDITLGLELEVKIPALADIVVPLLVEAGGGSGYLAYADCAVGDDNEVLLGLQLKPEAVKVSTQVLQSNGEPAHREIAVEILPDVRNLLSVSLSARLDGLLIGEVSSQPVLRELVYDLYSKEPVRAYVASGLGVATLGEGLDITATVSLQQEECSGLLSWLTCKLGDLLNPLLNGLLEDITAPAIKLLVEDVLVQVVDSVTSNILEPLLAGLGLNLGGMSVDVSHVSQGQVVLLDCSHIDCEFMDE